MEIILHYIPLPFSVWYSCLVNHFLVTIHLDTIGCLATEVPAPIIRECLPN